MQPVIKGGSSEKNTSWLASEQGGRGKKNPSERGGDAGCPGKIPQRFINREGVLGTLGKRKREKRVYEANGQSCKRGWLLGSEKGASHEERQKKGLWFGRGGHSVFHVWKKGGQGCPREKKRKTRDSCLRPLRTLVWFGRGRVASDRDRLKLSGR